MLTDLSLSNCTMGDFAAANLACALENNKTLEKLSIESNNVSPQTLVKIFEVRMKHSGFRSLRESEKQFLPGSIQKFVSRDVS